MAKIAYVDHSFHKKTLSTYFLSEILRRHGHIVEHFWDYAWKGGAPVDWRLVEKYDVVLMFQAYCPIGDKYYRQLHPNVVYIPMLDQFGIWKGPLFNLTRFWEPFQGSKVVNFSNALHCMTIGFGVQSRLVRYYQATRVSLALERSGLHGFFWLRREDDIPWETIRKLISNARFDSFHVHLASDPGTPNPRLPSLSDIERYKITTSTWFQDKSDFDSILERANVFFAARMEEGIGQSFLEALARGQCVVAPNTGTMNEYIIHGLNGLLYDCADPKALDFSDVKKLGMRGRESSIIGRIQWEQKERDLVDYIVTPSEYLYAGKYSHEFPAVRKFPTIIDMLRNASQKNLVLVKLLFISRRFRVFILNILKR